MAVIDLTGPEPAQEYGTVGFPLSTLVARAFERIRKERPSFYRIQVPPLALVDASYEFLTLSDEIHKTLGKMTREELRYLVRFVEEGLRSEKVFSFIYPNWSDLRAKGLSGQKADEHNAFILADWQPV